jgi:hypothetical protein
MNSILIFILITLSICCANEIKRAKETLRKTELDNNESVSKNSSVKAVIQQKLVAEKIEEIPIEEPIEEPDEETNGRFPGHYSYTDSVAKITVNYLLIISGLFVLVRI